MSFVIIFSEIMWIDVDWMFVFGIVVFVVLVGGCVDSCRENEILKV